MTKPAAVIILPFGELSAMGGRRFTRMRGQSCIYHRTGFNRDASQSGEDRGISEAIYVGGHTCGRGPESE